MTHPLASLRQANHTRLGSVLWGIGNVSVLVFLGAVLPVAAALLFSRSARNFAQYSCDCRVFSGSSGIGPRSRCARMARSRKPPGGAGCHSRVMLVTLQNAGR